MQTSPPQNKPGGFKTSNSTHNIQHVSCLAQTAK